MTSLMDAVAQAAADVPRLYRLGAVPKNPTYPYGVFSGSIARADAYTLDSTHHLRWVRVTAQFFGKTVDSVTTQTEAFLLALLDVSLTVDGQPMTPLRMELDPTSPTRDPDDNGVLGVTTTLTATKEA